MKILKWILLGVVALATAVLVSEYIKRRKSAATTKSNGEVTKSTSTIISETTVAPIDPMTGERYESGQVVLQKTVCRELGSGEIVITSGPCPRGFETL